MLWIILYLIIGILVVIIDRQYEKRELKKISRDLKCSEPLFILIVVAIVWPIYLFLLIEV